MYEGAPDYPDKDRFWAIIEKYGVTILYTAPTAIRAFMRWGDRVSRSSTIFAACACSARSASRSTRRPGSGTTSTSAADRCPVVDTWWQTETGMILITPAAGRHHAQAGLGDAALPGRRRRRSWTSRARGSAANTGGYLVIYAALAGHGAHDLGRPRPLRPPVLEPLSPACTSPATARAATTDGYFWLLGRVDDVLNVAGHRIGTMEVESALVSHPSVAEAAVIGISRRDQGPGRGRLRDRRGAA